MQERSNIQRWDSRRVAEATRGQQSLYIIAGAVIRRQGLSVYTAVGGLPKGLLRGQTGKQHAGV